MHRQEINRAAYNKIAAQWDNARTSFYGRERVYLDTFWSGLPVPSSVLDLGFGTGRPMAQHILNRGHNLTGVDQAACLITLFSLEASEKPL